MKPDHFLSKHSLFTRAELATALPQCSTGTLNAHLARWRKQGRIIRVKNELYMQKNPAFNQPTPPDFIALASRMAPDAVVSYHTALEAHGSAQSLFTNLTFNTWTRTKGIKFLGYRLIPVKPRAVLLQTGRAGGWVEQMERDGLVVRVTNLERTLVDVLDRPSLAGGMEEVWRSLAAFPAVDPVSLLDYVQTLNNKTLAARVGYFLESRRDDLAVPTETLKALHKLIPKHAVYMERSLGGKLNHRWNLIIPAEFAGSPEETGA